MAERPVQEGTEGIRTSAAALYTFLKEFTQLRSSTVRSLDQYDHVLWFSDIPREPECDCAAWHRGQDREGGEVWLQIRQPRLIPPPEPPSELSAWLISGQIADSALELPELRHEIAVLSRDESGGECVVCNRIEEHPDIKAAWERYVQDEWWPWAESDRRSQTVQEVYTRLFSIYQKQQRLGEQYEVVLGLGALSWRTQDMQEVWRHLLVVSTNIAFDAARGVITVGPAGEGAKVEIEQDMVDPTFRPEPDELRSLETQTADLGDRVWDPAPIDAILAGWVHAASSRGTYSSILEPPDRVQSEPRVHLAPALILRRRTERSFLKAFEEIIRQINDGASIPSGVARFVTVADEVRDRSEEDPETSRGRPTPELYFPLESNEAQRLIVQRLETHQGVLVQGPPGTGKSHTIVNLICHLLASGQRVLVTSHTARALRVLGRFIHERAKGISPLAVVLLGDDREALQAMEDSVQGITHRQNHWDPQQNARRIQELESHLDEARRDEAIALAELRAVRERETFSHHSRFGGYSGTLQSIAARLRREEDTFDWIEDRPGDAQDPPLPTERFQELVTLLRDATVDEWAATGHRAVPLESLPTPDKMWLLIEREAQATGAYENVAGARYESAYSALGGAPAEARKRVVEELSGALETVDQIQRHLHDWTETAVLQILGDHDRAWRELLQITKEHLQAVTDRARWADETPISWLIERDHHQVKADAEAIIKHFEGGGSWGFGPFRAAPAKRGQYLRREIRIGGRSCSTPEALRDLIGWLDVEERLRLLRERWGSVHRVPRRSFSLQVRDFEDLCEPLEAALELHDRVVRMRKVIRAIPGLEEPTWHDLESLQRLLVCARAVDEEERLREAQSALDEACERIRSEVESPGADPAGQELLRAAEGRDAAPYEDAFSRLVRNRGMDAQHSHREALLSRLRHVAPLLADQLSTTASHEAWDLRSMQFEGAWNWARATAWLEKLSDPEVEQQLQIQIDSARNRIRSRLDEIAAEKAWAHCFARMTEHERQHLVAWSKAVRAIGKGTGKYAAHHRRSAREHMNECRSAIPAWVMPLYRVAETIKPGADLFDVVIVDEASQSGPEALLLAYLAKKLVVVGDDKQISPTYAGINHEDVNQLRARHIAHLPHADAYGVNQSFFDLAEIRYQGRIRLREHFRCMPEIIQFSNNLCYASEPLIPLRQYGASRLSPIVSSRHVGDGYVKGSGQRVSNPPEAYAIVEEIVRMQANDAYAGKTLGVISLLGDAQAREIESLLLDKIGPEEMERRQLVCGDAYAFQGDERDVILLSMVSAPAQGRRIGTLADESARRRFNVAASRARDQLILFHTATLNELSPQCLRYALLRYCQHPSVERAELSGVPLSELQRLAGTADRDRLPPPEPFDSWFELDVFLQISARGYRVLPQYEVAGYRIDLVVEGMNRRVAVECDGDRWHGPERFDEDAARQRVLERCGWRFWRVRGSAFALDPDGAMEDLWDTLRRDGVYPEGHEPTEDVASPYEGASALRGPTPVASGIEPDGDSGSEPLTHETMSDTQEVQASEVHLVDETEPLQSKPSGRADDLVDSPYRAWLATRPLPDPTMVSPGDLIPGVVDIIGIEGPMSAQQLYRIFVKAAGRQRVGRQSKSALNKAVWRALREGLLEERNETGQGGLKERILRKAGSPAVVVRPRGTRDFVEIPPSEIATVMTRLQQRDISLRARALYRSVLDFYETKRMTRNIEQLLQAAEEQRDELPNGGVSS